ncbi:MAG: PQQ-dependent sugar dehydrogenase [Deltaproteobacteria bacterium]|nr:PQQ-dependent sugar dehydrogenase [Deltaproteobacteria bacterium]
MFFRALLAGLVALTVGSAHAAVIVVPVATINNPIYLAGSGVPGDQRLFVIEKGGFIRVIDGSVRSTPFLDISSKVSLGPEQGLLSLAFHPDFAATKAFYVNYTNTAGNTVIERYLVSSDPNVAVASSGKIMMVIPQPFANHNGGQLQVRKSDGHLYIGMGDGGGQQDPGCRSQTKSTLLGKMLRLNVRQNFDVAPYYGIPSDNPYVGARDPLNEVPDEVWSFGLRNPWRFSFDRQTNDLWIGDVGQGLWEEVNYVPANASGALNFGWKIMEGNACNESSACPSSTPGCNAPAFTPPVAVYPHGSTGDCSVTGGYFYRGSKVPELVGKYIYGDYCSGRVWTLAPTGAGTWTSTLLFDGGNSLTSFGEDNQGELYAMFGNALVKLASDAPPPASVPALGARNGALLGVAFLLLALAHRRRSQYARRRGIIIVAAVLCVPTLAQARPFRVDQIPNGSIKSCDNCHIYPGGPRNLFGQDIEDHFLDGPAGNVVWNAALAALDSDKDGRSNGVELQDPNGVWRLGLPNPGSAAGVTLPGTIDAAPRSVPALSSGAAILLAGLLCWVSHKSRKA